MDLITLALSKKYTNKAVSEAQLAPTSFKVVDVLPATGEIGIIYLVPKVNGKDKNIYTEYIWTNDAFEAIGDTEINLQDYATIEYVDNKSVPADWEQANSSAVDYVKNRTHYVDYLPGRMLLGESEAYFEIGNAPIPSWTHYPSFDTGVVLEEATGTKCIVYFDDEVYVLEVVGRGIGAHATLGDWGFSYEGGAEHAEYPFLWDSQGFFVKEPGKHSIIVHIAEESVHTLDMKYIDNNELWNTLYDMGIRENPLEIFTVRYNQTNAATYQPIVDAVFAGKTVEIRWTGGLYSVFHLTTLYDNSMQFQELDWGTSTQDAGYSRTSNNYISIRFDPNTHKITSVNKFVRTFDYISPTNNYSNPYMPQYDGSPATKKYVDDSISSAITAAIEGAY